MPAEPNDSNFSATYATQEHSLSLVNASIPNDSQRMGELLASIPKELLGEIFRWCCASYDDRFCASPMAPLTLSHVCQMWRTVAFSTPELWTYVSLGAPKRSCESATELMLLWVQNAKHCPLVVDVDLTFFAAFKKPDVILPTVMEMVELAIDRKGEEVDTAEGQDLSRFLRVSVEPSIVVKFPYVAEEYFWSSEERPFEQPPKRGAFRLRVATKPSVLLGMDGHRSFAPYLVHLNLRDEDRALALTTEEALGVIRFFLNLEHLEITIGYPEETSDGDGRRYTLEKLKTFSLTWIDNQEPSVVLSSLAAPNLENLELDGVLPPSDFFVGNTWTHLRTFLRASSPPLRTLNLYKLCAEDIDLIGCLALIHNSGNLDRLWLDECVLDERTIRAFAEATHMGVEGAQRALEGLTTLGLVKCEIFGAREWYQRLVLTGLVWGVTKLRGVYIMDCDIHPGVSETLHLLRSRYEAGLYDVLD